MVRKDRYTMVERDRYPEWREIGAVYSTMVVRERHPVMKIDSYIIVDRDQYTMEKRERYTKVERDSIS
jgi:hypothetical protein